MTPTSAVADLSRVRDYIAKTEVENERLRREVEQLKGQLMTRAHRQEQASKRAPSHYIRMRDLVEMTGMSRAWIYGEMKNSRFPSSIKLSERSVVWVRSEVEAWIEDKTGKRQEG